MMQVGCRWDAGLKARFGLDLPVKLGILGLAGCRLRLKSIFSGGRGEKPVPFGDYTDLADYADWGGGGFFGMAGEKDIELSLPTPQAPGDAVPTPQAPGDCVTPPVYPLRV